MFGWTLALLCFYFFLNGKGVLPFPVVYLQCRVQLPSNRTVPMFEDGDSRVSQQLASQWHCCFFLISLRLNLDIKCRLISPRALSLFLPRHSTHIQASHSNWNAGHGFGRSTLRPPQPEFLHLPLRHGPPGALPESASACLQPLSMWVTVYSGLAIKVTLPFSLLIYCHYRCIHFLQHSCLYSWIFKGEKIYMFKTVFLFFINQYQASKQMFNWYEYKLIHACYIKLEN